MELFISGHHMTVDSGMHKKIASVINRLESLFYGQGLVRVILTGEKARVKVSVSVRDCSKRGVILGNVIAYGSDAVKTMRSAVHKLKRLVVARHNRQLACRRQKQQIYNTE
jgi:ribosome-associated translation inhibitor RaiA